MTNFSYSVLVFYLWTRSGKSSKYGENGYKSSLGCLEQKPMGALNSTKIGGDFKPKKFQKCFLKNW
jgi:hypothetical protein